MDRVKVIFRKSKFELFALFPGLAGTNDASTCTSYAHLGQHSSADYSHCIATSRPATPEEYAPLLAELRGIYEAGPDAVRLVVGNRASQADRAERISQLGRAGA